MRCRYCNIALAPSRSFVDGEFCCDAHREAFEADEAAGVPATVFAANPVSAAIEKLRRMFKACPTVADEPELALEPEIPEGVQELEGMNTEPVLEPEAAFASEAYQAESYQAVSSEDGSSQDRSSEVESSKDESAGEVQEPHLNTARETAVSWRWIAEAWKGAPRDLKLIGLLLPVLLFIAITGSIPKVPIPQLAPKSVGDVQVQFQKVVEDHWKNLNASISDRAAVAYSDDFRSGLDAWDSRSNLTRTWSYDAAGFVRPGPLAVFKPTVDLTDYRFEFLGEIDQKAMGWAFRAQDLDNYYAMKFVVVKPGPLPLIHMVRYAVIHGKEGPHVDKPLPLTTRLDMLYRIQVNAQGDDFTIMAQGQVVDFWSDSRLQHGGVGFFCNRGERARLRWVEVSHQYDALGRLCAYLAPYGIEGRNGNIN